MSINSSRLDRYISQRCNIKRGDVRLLIAQKRIRVNGTLADNVAQLINTFSIIELDQHCLQKNQPYYVMLHKPTGVVSATKDKKHITVIDLLVNRSIISPDIGGLHIVGRLDLNTSGLLLVTNDSRWSEGITDPTKQVAKRYHVRLKRKVSIGEQKVYIEAFQQGMYFPYERLTTKPAKLVFLSDTLAVITLFEGRYHQIKRMFGRFRNPVIALHRFAVGQLFLPDTLAIGDGCTISADHAYNAIPSARFSRNMLNT